MPIPAEYRPAITTVVDARVELDGWAAGASGAASGTIDAQGTEWLLTNLEGWHAAPEVRNSLVERAGEHGSFSGPAFLASRILTVEGVAQALDLPSALRARDIVASVAADVATTFTMTVFETGRPTRQCVVRRSAETKTSPIFGNAFAWSMILVAPDPRRYSATLNSQQVGLPAVSGGGLVWPLVFPLFWGSGISGGEMTLTNAGTFTVWPAWEILGPVTGPTITNIDSGARLAFDPAFVVASGQTLFVDPDAKTVTLLGVNRRDRLFTAEWFRLPPGLTRIRFGSAAGTDPAARLTGRWRDGW